MATLKDPGPRSFDAVLQATSASGSACFVPFPFDLTALYGKGNLVPVQVVWDGRVTYRGSLAKMGGPHAIVLCRTDVVRALGKRAGDAVHVTVTLDTAPRPVELPPLLAAALDAEPALAAAWAALSPSCQREYASWIADAKRPETAHKRLAEAAPRIRAGRRRSD